MKFYFIFKDSSEYPYQNGWIEIDAKNEHDAREIFKQEIPCKKQGVLNCSEVYDESKFKKTNMYLNRDNLNYKCFGTINADTYEPLKLEIDSLVIEVTRKCNMNCAHCLRGDAQNIDMAMETIEPILRVTKSIYTLTFTGGEPSLNTDLIDDILEYCKLHNIIVYNFFIATNGKEISSKFLYTILKWYSYCIECNNGWEPEITEIALSKDMYHEEINPQNERLLRSLTFFSETKMTDFNEFPPIDRGRASNISNAFHKDYITYIDCEKENDETMINGTIYVSANGNIVSDCDIAYDDIDNKYKLGNTNNMLAFKEYIEGRINT